MRILKWTMSLAVLAVCVAPAAAQQSIQTAFNYNLADDAAARGGCASHRAGGDVGLRLRPVGQLRLRIQLRL